MYDDYFVVIKIFDFDFEIDTSPSTFELERRSKAQNVENAHGYDSGIFNSRYNFR